MLIIKFLRWEIVVNKKKMLYKIKVVCKSLRYMFYFNLCIELDEESILMLISNGYIV